MTHTVPFGLRSYLNVLNDAALSLITHIDNGITTALDFEAALDNHHVLVSPEDLHKHSVPIVTRVVASKSNMGSYTNSLGRYIPTFARCRAGTAPHARGS